MKYRRHIIIAGLIAAGAIAAFATSSVPSVMPVVSPGAVSHTMQTPLGQKTGPGQIYPLVSGAIDQDTTNNVQGTICNPGWSTKSIRPPVSYTDPIKTVALQTYNATWGTSYAKPDGELDHVISLELGGSPTSTDNLFFEPYNTQVEGKRVGAHEKDSVENLLHKEVCDGTVSIRQAQQIITADWYACYLRSNGGAQEFCK